MEEVKHTEQNTGLPFVFGRKGDTVNPVESLNRADNFINWGSDNLYPQWINGLFYQSAIHSGIIRSKVFYTTSGGIEYDGADKDKYALMFENGTSEFDLQEVVEQMSMDLELSNMIAIRGRWSVDRTRCERLDLIPFETVRKMADSNKIAVCADWSDNKKGFTLYEPLDLINKKSLVFYVLYEDRPKQMIFTGQKAVESGKYPLVPYIGGVKSIQTDIEVVNYQHSEIINNFAYGTILNLNNGRPKVDGDRKKLEKRIKNASGTDDAGGTIVLFNDGKDNEATVVKLNGNDLNDRYLSLSEDNRKNILTSHSVTSTTLFGLEMGGNFNASEMEIGFNLMDANYFQYKRRVISRILNRIANKCNGMQGSINLLPAKLIIPKNTTLKKVKASSDDTKRIIDRFSKVGRPKEGLTMLSTASLNVDDVEGSGLSFMEDFKKEHFAIKDETLANILKFISNGDSFDAIAKSLDMNPSDLAKRYSDLQNGGYLDDEGKITRQGILEVASSDASKLSIVYSYELRPDAPPLVEGGKSRDFCAEMIRLNRVYTRDEIDQISALEQRNVWTFKGGWYHDPNTEKNRPSCRHYWTQNIVFS